MSDSLVTLPDSWFSQTEQLFLSRAEEFRLADPFPYVVIDSFLPPEVATACARAFPLPGSEKWIHYAHLNSSKWGMTDLEQMPDELRSVTVALNSPRFTSALSTLSGVPDVEADPELSGGGLHVTRNGGFLNVHSDFVSHPSNRSWRRQLNLLLYLTEDWQEQWGGQLELWDVEMKRAVHQVVPVFNRCVIFRTSETSYHGVPNPLRTPESVQRNSLALYYFSNEHSKVKMRPTNYRPRPVDGRRGALLKVDNAALSLYSRLRVSLGINDQSMGKLLGKFRRPK